MRDDERRAAEQGRPLRNPLPLPRKRAHAPMEFDIEPEHDGVMDEFDFEPIPFDDFELKDQQ